MPVGGAGWEPQGAEAAGVGEAVERWQPYPLPQDEVIDAAFASWPLGEPAVEPSRWVLFHADQYDQPGFPFGPLHADAGCRWVCCRDAVSGAPWWVPEGFVFLQARPGLAWPFAPSVSTGLAAGRAGDPVLLRGLQEVIERDALVGAWWGRYPLYEHPADAVFSALPAGLRQRLLRPNLHYRFYRVGTPFSGHVTLVTMDGEDREGWCFSVGSACRHDGGAALQKALLEAVQGRHYIRYLLANTTVRVDDGPTDFAGHAAYYSLHAAQLARTVLAPTGPVDPDPVGAEEGLAQLTARLGPGYPVLYRDLTPPALAAEGLGWVVLRVVVPGLQPLHGHHGYPFLGGPLWGARPAADWRHVPPHPFP
jgi:ribosomal protein S12 methylthiotransferase accessory factor